MEKTVIGFEADYLFGYVNKERYLVSNTVEQICAFIMKYRHTNVLLVNILDQAEIETSMGLLFYVKDQQFLRDTLQPAIIPMQLGEVDIPEFVPYEPEMEYVIKNVRIESEDCYYLGIVDFESGYPELFDRQYESFETESALKEAHPESISWSEATEQAIQKGWIESEANEDENKTFVESDKQSEFNANFIDDKE